MSGLRTALPRQWIGAPTSTRIYLDRGAAIAAAATAGAGAHLRRSPFGCASFGCAFVDVSLLDVNILDASASGAVGAAPDRPLRVGVLVDLEYAPSAGGHVKYWQRLAEAAVDIPEALALPVHFHGREKRDLKLSPLVRFALLPPVFSTARLLSHRHFPDHTDIA